MKCALCKTDGNIGVITVKVAADKPGKLCHICFNQLDKCRDGLKWQGKTLKFNADKTKIIEVAK